MPPPPRNRPRSIPGFQALVSAAAASSLSPPSRPRRPARACIRIQGCRRQFGAAAAARPSPRGALAAPAAPSLAAAEAPIATAVANAVSAALAAHLAALTATHVHPRLTCPRACYDSA